MLTEEPRPCNRYPNEPFDSPQINSLLMQAIRWRIMPQLPGRQRQHIGTSVKKASHSPESPYVWGTFFPIRRKRAKEEKDVFWTSSLSSIRNVLFVQALAYFHLGDFSCAPGVQPPVELHPRGLSSRAPRLLHGSDHAKRFTSEVCFSSELKHCSGCTLRPSVITYPAVAPWDCIYKIYL